MPNGTNQPSRPVSKGDADEVLKLVNKWLAEEEGYDASAWPVIVQDIEQNRLSNRYRFQGQDHDTSTLTRAARG